MSHPFSGPSEITVYHPDVFMAVDGPQGTCVKSEWYDLLNPKQSLVTARVKEVHGGASSTMESRIHISRYGPVRTYFGSMP